MYHVFAFTQRNIKKLTEEVKAQDQPTPAENSIPLETYPTPAPPPLSHPYPPSSPVGYPPTDGATYAYPPQPYSYPPTYPQPTFANPAQPYPYPPQQPNPQVTFLLTSISPLLSFSYYLLQVVQVQAMELNPPAPGVYVDHTPSSTSPSSHERIPEAQEKLKLFTIFYKLMMVYIIVTIVCLPNLSFILFLLSLYVLSVMFPF